MNDRETRKGRKRQAMCIKKSTERTFVKDNNSLRSETEKRFLSTSFSSPLNKLIINDVSVRDNGKEGEKKNEGKVINRLSFALVLGVD